MRTYREGGAVTSMIDIFNEVFTYLAAPLRDTFSGIRVSAEYVQIPASYPCVTIDETYNVEVESDSSNRERYNRVRYRVQVFSNKKSGKRAEARNIQNKVDELFRDIGFYRTSYSTTPDIINNTVYCITSIFSAVVDENGFVHGSRS